MRIRSLANALLHPRHGVDRLLWRILTAEQYCRWRGFGTLDDCRRIVRDAFDADNVPVFVFPAPSVAWGYLFQRPQQMARALARLGFTVLYAADSGFVGPPDRGVHGLMRLEPNLYLYADGRDGRMISALRRPCITWCYWPHHATFLQHLPADSRVIYDCVDEVRLFAQYPGIDHEHEHLLDRADLVLATADRLLEGIRGRRPDAMLVPNACVYEDFAQPTAPPPKKLERLRRNAEVLIGYYGALAEWIDWDLIRAIARARPAWQMLLVGDDWNQVAKKERMYEIPNVHIWPRQPYGRLGTLLAHFDVATVPFKVNDITKSVSPIKLFEYMAGGKPIVSAPLDECRKYPPIQLATDAAEWIDRIEWCLSDGRTPSHRNELQACAHANTWRQRAEQVARALKMPLGQ